MQQPTISTRRSLPILSPCLAPTFVSSSRRLVQVPAHHDRPVGDAVELSVALGSMEMWCRGAKTLFSSFVFFVE
jgi:hypothetical protein